VEGRRLDVEGRRLDVEGRMMPGRGLHGGQGRLQAAVRGARGGGRQARCLTCTAGVSSNCDGLCSAKAAAPPPLPRPPSPIMRMGDLGDRANEESSAGAEGDDSA
jgi:hypothetical protein